MIAHWDNKKKKIVIDGNGDIIYLPQSDKPTQEQIMDMIEITNFKFIIVTEPQHVHQSESYR